MWGRHCENSSMTMYKRVSSRDHTDMVDMVDMLDMEDNSGGCLY